MVHFTKKKKEEKFLIASPHLLPTWYFMVTETGMETGTETDTSF